MNVESPDILGEYNPQGLPRILDLLTILTFIGCGLSLYSLVDSFYSAIVYHENYSNIVRDYPGSQAIIEFHNKAEFRYETRYLLLSVGLLSIVLCLIGAIKMRKQQKSGLYIYLSGEIGYPVFLLILYGFVWNGFLDFLDYVTPFLFSALYLSQRTHLR